MFTSKKTKRNSELDSLVGANTKLIGDVHFSGGLHIDGTIQGNVIAEGEDSLVTTSEKGRIEGNVHVHNMVLSGEVVGDVYALKHIELAPNARVTGNVVSGLPYVTHIFLNNIRVLFFVLLFAFFYGVGAIFILAWNASVIGVAVGNFVRSHIHLSYFSALPLGLLRYSIHGIPEILAYFMAGLAGGIISVAVTQHQYGSAGFRKVLFDSLDLAVGSIVVLFIAALMEVYVTPVFFV